MIIQYVYLRMVMYSAQAVEMSDQPAPTRAHRDISSPEVHSKGLANSRAHPHVGQDQQRHACVSSISSSN